MLVFLLYCLVCALWVSVPSFIGRINGLGISHLFPGFPPALLACFLQVWASPCPVLRLLRHVVLPSLACPPAQSCLIDCLGVPLLVNAWLGPLLACFCCFLFYGLPWRAPWRYSRLALQLTC
ncbi:hypothetical protein JTE90_010650 [Oedothorax gibbosus]|uniref:Uncharacterized protein n=1 Tax=Oedothorax gibbosus TaxID=931172 RepID=A0AAV6TKR4_9ARAC|nr:hypothetical protein JTE90_010650 [Oedothorax gibbosus]